jgi:cytochrome c oxidase subunit 3
MADTLVEENIAAAALLGSEEAAETAVPLPAGTVALWVILATVAMLFAGFTSAYLVRRTALDWAPVYAPHILWVNTAVLLVSSAGLELAKDAQGSGSLRRTRIWLLLAAGLGGVFLILQMVAWRELSSRGIFLPTSPHGSFLYMLTGVHAVHVLGGLAALVTVLGQNWRRRVPGTSHALALSAVYWHFVTGIWVFLYFLLFLWR